MWFYDSSERFSCQNDDESGGNAGRERRKAGLAAARKRKRPESRVHSSGLGQRGTQSGGGGGRSGTVWNRQDCHNRHVSVRLWRDRRGQKTVRTVEQGGSSPEQGGNQIILS